MDGEIPKPKLWEKIFKPKNDSRQFSVTEEVIAEITLEASAALANSRPRPVGLIGKSMNVDLVTSSIETTMQGQGFDIIEVEITNGLTGNDLVDTVASARGLKRDRSISSGITPLDEIIRILNNSDKRKLVVFQHCENFSIGEYINLARQVRSIYNGLSLGKNDPNNAIRQQFSFLMTGTVDPNDSKIWNKGDRATLDNVTRYYNV